jgi:hypothetical protein
MSLHMYRGCELRDIVSLCAGYELRDVCLLTCAGCELRDVVS